MAETLIAYKLKDAINLAYDVSLAVQHQTDERDAKHAYQAKLLAQLFRDTPGLFEPVIEEISHVVNDNGLQRIVNRLEDFVDTSEWPIKAETLKKERLT